jgi:sugar lactone lactonase YvrE
VAPELVADYQCHTGEGPLWHPTEKLLYWADIPTGRMFRYSPATGEHEQFYQGDVVGGFTFQEDGALLLFMAKGAVATWRDDKLSYIISEIPDEREGRFNDVFADPRGRVFCGSMPTEGRLGRLYRLDTDGTLTTLLEGINVSNGMGFTPDGKQLYYTESMTHKIYLFDYEIDSGNISNQRVWLETSEDEGVPDGMTVDSEGFVWSARFGGSSVIRYTPEGVEERRIRFPATRVTSLIFAGDDLTDIYVTTGGGQNKAEYGSGAGGLFHFNTGIKGVPEFFSRVGL